MPEDDGPVAHAREHALVVITRLDREALAAGERRAVHIEDSVHLDLRLQRVQPPLLSAHAWVCFFELLGDVRSIRRWLPEPALAVAADPGRVREFAQTLQPLQRPRRPRAEVAAENEREEAGRS